MFNFNDNKSSSSLKSAKNEIQENMDKVLQSMNECTEKSSISGVNSI